MPVMEASAIENFVLEREAVIRLGLFASVFITMFIWELLAPRRNLTVSKSVRWANNLVLLVLNSFVLRLLFPAAAVGMAY